MAKELPFFKFEPNQWENGNIQMCSREARGLFIDMCSVYWSRLGDLPLKLAIQKLCAGNATALNPLIDENIIAINDGQITIEFLDEQLQEFKETSSQNSRNAKKRWEKVKPSKDLSEGNATASIPQSDGNAIREDKIREDKIREEKIIEDNTKKVEFSNFNDMEYLTIEEARIKYDQFFQKAKSEFGIKNGIKRDELKTYQDKFDSMLISKGNRGIIMKRYAEYFVNWVLSKRQYEGNNGTKTTPIRIDV